MNDSPLKINTGSVDYVKITPQGCLKDSDGKFYSTQNAVRLHEWLRGTETAPLVLEAVKKSKDGTFEVRNFGNVSEFAYPKQWHAGQLLKLEQIALAAPAIREQLDKAITWTEESGREEKITEALSATTVNLMGKFRPMVDFNASAIFFDHEIPEKFQYHTLDTLDRLCTFVLTQRRKEVQKSFADDQSSSLDLDMYEQLDLDRVIGRIHQAVLNGFFPDPEEQAKHDGLKSGWFFKQCALAFSEITETPVPVAYLQTQLGSPFYWAKKVLLSLKEEIPSLVVRPKPQNVVTFPSK